MNATPRTLLHALVFVAALFASIATSTMPAWEIVAETTALEVSLPPGGEASFDLVIRGNRAAFEQAEEAGAANAALLALLTAEEGASSVVTLRAAVLPEEVAVDATIDSSTEPVSLTAEGTWAPTSPCTIEKENTPAGCSVTIRATLSNGGGGTVSGKLQGFVQLYGPDEPPDETASGALEVTLVPVTP